MTTIELFDALVREVRKIASTSDFLFPRKDGVIAKPQVFEFYLPPRNAQEAEVFPYIVVQSPKEEQQMLQGTHEAIVEFVLVVGVYHDTTNFSISVRDLHTAMEHLAVALKDIHLLGGLGELMNIKKEIPPAHPIPYFQGEIKLTYSYFKPVRLPEP